MPIMVKATDAYGRVQTCSVDFPVVPTAVDVLVQARAAGPFLSFFVPSFLPGFHPFVQHIGSLCFGYCLQVRTCLFGQTSWPPYVLEAAHTALQAASQANGCSNSSGLSAAGQNHATAECAPPHWWLSGLWIFTARMGGPEMTVRAKDTGISFLFPPKTRFQNLLMLSDLGE